MIAALTTASCIAVLGANITAGDLAKAVPAFTPRDASAVVGYAPEPGVMRTFYGAELRQALARFGYETSVPFPDVCFSRQVRELKQDELLAAMRRTLGSTAKIEIVEVSQVKAPLGEITFPLEELGSPPVALWHGYVLYDGNKKFPIWARVTASVQSVRAVALTELRPGTPIDPSEVAFASVEEFPARRTTPQNAAQIAGCTPRRFIAANTPVWNDSIDPPNDVSRGERAAVTVSSGGAHLTVDAEAQSSGRRGDLIAFKNPESGRLFRARISGHGTAVIETASVNP